MSASREKQNRRERVNSGWIDPKTAREAQQRRQEKRTSVLYDVIAVVFLAVAAAALIYRSKIIPKSTRPSPLTGRSTPPEKWTSISRTPTGVS